MDAMHARVGGVKHGYYIYTQTYTHTHREKIIQRQAQRQTDKQECSQTDLSFPLLSSSLLSPLSSLPDRARQLASVSLHTRTPAGRRAAPPASRQARPPRSASSP